MERLRQQRGFTLIELAIVLVIIGIILGAVLRGQDLIQSARTKRFINDAARRWEVASWTIFDRRGAFPGDGDSNGIIGEDAGDNPQNDITTANLINPPTASVNLGSFTFFTFLGSDDVVAAATPQNLIIICRDVACNTFTPDEIVFAEAFDTAIDGTTDGTLGQVRGINIAPNNITAANWLATFDNDTTATGFANYAAAATNAILYFYDRQAN